MRYARYLLLFFALPAVAKTPDGKPPAVETVCDAYHGAAYGLCNSYCEARDCDDPRVHASDRSCEVTEARFLAMTGEALVCSGEEPPPAACTADAVDDGSMTAPMDISFSVLTNDKYTSLASISTVSTVDSHGDPADGALEIRSDGTLTVTPLALDSTYTVEYQICCDASTCDTATAQVTVPGA